jgi:hypothetical protein
MLAVLVMTAVMFCMAPNASIAENSDGFFPYTNLLDDSGRQVTMDALEMAGVPAENIAEFFRQVDYYNDAIGRYGLTETGFEETIGADPPYDPYEMQDVWDRKNPDFIGYNCRITSYTLMKGLIAFEDPRDEESDYLVFDEMSIAEGTNISFCDEDLRNFRTLYFSMPAEDTRDIARHADNVQSYYSERGISFLSDKVSLISVYFHDEEGILFVGHAGVLVPYREDFLFIEKVSFPEPYQVIRFENKNRLNAYLMEKYDVSWGQPVAKPFVMENDRLMISP